MSRARIPADERLQSSQWWITRRELARTQVYPTGTPTGVASATVADWDIEATTGYTMPLGCASITRYENTNPGGRVGTSLYAELCNPSAPAVNKCLVMIGGHTLGWWDAHCDSDGSGIIPIMLARGWHVLGVNMPNYPGNPQPQGITLGGSLSTPANAHPYSAGYADGGASVTRQFTDTVLFMNQVTTDTGITDFSLVGHSGGANSAMYLAIMDSRFNAVHVCQPGSVYWYRGTSTDAELDLNNPTAVAAKATWPFQLFPLGACYPGRQYVLHVSPNDEYEPVTDPWVTFAPTVDASMVKHFGSRFTFRPKTSTKEGSSSPYHAMDATQVSFIVDHLATNG